jgi:hypothetical protein
MADFKKGGIQTEICILQSEMKRWKRILMASQKVRIPVEFVTPASLRT